MIGETIQQLQKGNTKILARTISRVENETEGYKDLLFQLPLSPTKITGITGPPGAGKSTLVDSLIGEMLRAGKKTGVLCIDPSSPFNHGSLLGDRIRMREWYNEPKVFIRSLASRGSLGGLHPKIIEITDVMRAADFDNIIIETVGVGQSEIEIAALADTTVVVLVPESGDEIQTMKAGIMEIADIFVINKADRPSAENFEKNLRLMLAPAFSNKQKEIAIIKTIATEKKGVKELMEAILLHQKTRQTNEKKFRLLTEKAYQLIMQSRMKNISKKNLEEEIQKNYSPEFNLYRFAEKYF